jgi:hypothetical protein
VPLSHALLEERARAVERAAAACYAVGGEAGLPAHEPVQRLLVRLRAGEPERGGGAEELSADTSALWGPGGRRLELGKLLRDFCGGGNEKTRVLLRLGPATEAASRPTPGPSEEEQRAALAFYSKRQAEAARLAACADADDAGADAAWADPGALKAHFAGIGQVKLGGGWASSGGGFNSTS